MSCTQKTVLGSTIPVHFYNRTNDKPNSCPQLLANLACTSFHLGQFKLGMAEAHPPRHRTQHLHFCTLRELDSDQPLGRNGVGVGSAINLLLKPSGEGVLKRARCLGFFLDHGAAVGYRQKLPALLRQQTLGLSQVVAYRPPLAVVLVEHRLAIAPFKVG